MVNKKSIYNRYNSLYPNDWGKLELGNTGNYFGGLTNKNKSDFENGNCKFITYRNINKNTFVNPNDFGNVRVKDGENQNEVRPGDVLFTGSSETPDEAGMSSVMLEDLKGVYLNSFCFGFRFENQDKFHPKFYGYYFRGDSFRKAIYPLAQGSTRYNLAKSELIKVNIAIPPITEQRKITSILTTIDNAIEKTEAIIEQTEKVKKGLMQQLLTKGIGHTKFKKTEIGEIPEEWEVVPLNKVIFSLKAGVSVNSENRIKGANEKGILKTSAVTDRLFNPMENKAILPHEVERAAVSPKKGQIIISRMNTPLLVGASSYVDKDYTDLFLPDRLWQTEIDEGNCSLWLSYVLTWTKMRARISEIATGTSGSMKNISKRVFLNLKIALPTIGEQRKIAEILLSIDKKVTIEQAKLDRLENIKNGLMQVLLTGKVRVKVDE